MIHKIFQYNVDSINRAEITLVFSYVFCLTLSAFLLYWKKIHVPSFVSVRFTSLSSSAYQKSDLRVDKQQHFVTLCFPLYAREKLFRLPRSARRHSSDSTIWVCLFPLFEKISYFRLLLSGKLKFHFHSVLIISCLNNTCCIRGIAWRFRTVCSKLAKCHSYEISLIIIVSRKVKWIRH